MKRFLNRTVLKIAALITMTLDHIGVLLMDVYPVSTSNGYNVALAFRMIGRIAFPLYVFMLVEGLRHTRNKWKYCGRLALFCLPITLFELGASLYLKDMDIMPAHAFTELLLYALIATLWTGKKWQKPLAILPIAYVGLSFAAELSLRYGFADLSWFPRFMWSDYDLFGLILFILFYFAYPIVDFMSKGEVRVLGITKEEYQKTEEYRGRVNLLTVLFLITVNIAFWTLAYFFGSSSSYLYQFHLQTYSVVAALFIFFYNGKRGYSAKWFNWFNYIYYPVHLITIYLVFTILFWM